MRHVVRSCVCLCALAIALVALSARPAQASFVLTIDDLTPAATSSQIRITDNGAGDSDSRPGIVAYLGNVGNFSVVLTLATTYSEPDLAQLQMSATVMSLFPAASNGPQYPSVLQFQLTNTDFQLATQNPDSPSNATLASAVSVNSLSSANPVTFDSYVDPLNAEFGQSLVALHQAVSPPLGASSNSMNFQFGDDHRFSLTQVVKVTHSAPGQTTNLSITTLAHAPEPASLAAWSLLSLLGLPLLRRRTG